MNATHRPIPPEILAAVAEGAMPLAVFADWLEDRNQPGHADAFRRIAERVAAGGLSHWLSRYDAWHVLREMLCGAPIRNAPMWVWQWLYSDSPQQVPPMAMSPAGEPRARV
jgi:hypothetical protein